MLLEASCCAHPLQLWLTILAVGVTTQAVAVGVIADTRVIPKKRRVDGRTGVWLG